MPNSMLWTCEIFETQLNNLFLELITDSAVLEVIEAFQIYNSFVSTFITCDCKSIISLTTLCTVSQSDASTYR